MTEGLDDSQCRVVSVLMGRQGDEAEHESVLHGKVYCRYTGCRSSARSYRVVIARVPYKEGTRETVTLHTSRKCRLQTIFAAVVFALVGANFPLPSLAASSGQMFTIARVRGTVIGPVISSRLVAWVASSVRPHPAVRHVTLGDVYAEDLRTGKVQRMTAGSYAVASPLAPEGVTGQIAASDRVIVWVDCRRCRDVSGLEGVAGADMVARDLRSGRETRLPGAYSAAVAGGMILWIDCCAIRRHLYVTDAASGHTRFVLSASYLRDLSTDGRTLVYAGNGDIYGRDLRSGLMFTVARHHGRESLTSPRVSGAFVIWTRQGLPDGSAAIEGRNLRTGRTYGIARVPQGQYLGWVGPRTAISGAVAVWDAAQRTLGPRGAPFEIWGENLSTGRRFVIGAAGCCGAAPSISGRTVVWRAVILDSTTGRLRRSEMRGAVLP